MTPKLGTNDKVFMMGVKRSTSAADYAALARRRNTFKMGHVKKLVKRREAVQAEKFDKCHGRCSHAEHQPIKPPPEELLTPYERNLTNLATPDFSTQSKAVK